MMSTRTGYGTNVPVQEINTQSYPVINTRFLRMCNDKLNAFINEFTSIISSLENSNNYIIIAGDFNINLLN